MRAAVLPLSLSLCLSACAGQTAPSATPARSDSPASTAPSSSAARGAADAAAPAIVPPPSATASRDPRDPLERDCEAGKGEACVSLGMREPQEVNLTLFDPDIQPILSRVLAVDKSAH